MARKPKLDANTFGIFAGSEGLSSFDEMEVEQGSDAFIMTRACEVCGQAKELHIPWAEMYCLQYGVDPARVGQAINRPDLFNTSWQYNQALKCLHPNVRCNCASGGILMIYNLTPIEAQRQLESAGRNGVISEGQQAAIRAISPVVKRLAGRSSGVPAQQVQQQMQRGMAPNMPGGQRR